MRLNTIAAGQGPVVVLLHGLFGAAGNWGSIQKALAERYRVLALDLRNHGASPHAATMDQADMAADVAETLAAEGAVPAAVIGHSLGGKVAMALAQAHPATVLRLLVADIAPVAYPPSLRGYVAAMQGLALTPGLTRRAADAALAGAVPEAGIRAFLLQNLRLDLPVPAWRFGLDEIAAAMPALEAAPPLGPPYQGPVLAVSGTRSPYVREEHHAVFRSLFPAVRFASLPTGHWVHAEDPKGFLALAEAFLSE
ncbi:pimeloyl-ACP methyl ester carboxylesterase [Humitalea rosea]|uniref:Pimeloyl-ACP methyl ester carboxylesterase n=1 Tax=Humitalea rosea TaxID=990373 RepID=A0A2W7IY21_9PROT|nr:alpha/beta fold hydrolase [Humitalea rosea]PZW43553.1 pimeloyl-ACP methyl ester carboxylesterase [Humitalea rosea]